MLYEKRPCQPLCKAPDKRDFQSYDPEKSSDDFYANYDPMVGIGTAAILMLIILVITVKSLLRWTIRHWRSRKYAKCLRIEVEKRVSFMEGTARLSLRKMDANGRGGEMLTTTGIHPNGSIL